MATVKTIGIVALILMLSGTSGVILYKNINPDKPSYYCETRVDIGPKQCVYLSKYIVNNGKCIFTDKTFLICKTGWVKIIGGTPVINKSVQQDYSVQYSCDPIKCIKI